MKGLRAVENQATCVKCEYMGCEKHGVIQNDVKIAPGVIEKKYVCEEHKVQIVGNIQVKSYYKMEEKILQDLPEVKVIIGEEIAPDEIKESM